MAAQRAKEAQKALRRAKALEEDEDYDEEEEEEEKEEEDGVSADEKKKMIIAAHKLVKGASEFLSESQGKVENLALRPLPDLYAVTKNALRGAIDSIEQIAEHSRVEATIPLDFPIPPLVRSIDSPEAEAAWTRIISGSFVEELNPADQKKKNKDGPPVPKKELTKGKKGVVQENVAPTELQICQYRRSLYHGIQKSIIDVCIDDMFAILDGTLERTAESSDSEAYHLENAAVIRDADLNLGEHTPIVFVNFDGGAFIEEDMRSAYEASEARRKAALESVCVAGDKGAAAIVLIFEMSSENNIGLTDDNWSLLNNIHLIRKRLEGISEKAAEKYDKKWSKKRKGVRPPPPPPKYVVKACPSFAALEAEISSLPSKRQGRNVPVLVLETICLQSKLVPDEPVQEEYVSDDDEPRIPLGQEAARADRTYKWTSQAPRRISVEVYINGGLQVIPALTDVTAALNDIIQKCKQRSGGLLWIEANPTSLFMPATSTLHKLKLDPPGRLVSSQLRQALVWASVLSLQRAASVQRLRLAYEEKMNDSELEGTNLEMEPSLLNFFSGLFPLPAAAPRPRFLAVLGGQFTIEKLRLLDELIDHVCYANISK